MAARGVEAGRAPARFGVRIDWIGGGFGGCGRNCSRRNATSALEYGSSALVSGLVGAARWSWGRSLKLGVRVRFPASPPPTIQREREGVAGSPAPVFTARPVGFDSPCLHHVLVGDYTTQPHKAKDVSDSNLEWLEDALGKLQTETASVMRLINRRLQELGEAIRFEEAAINATAGTVAGLAGIKGDTFYGKRLGTAMREYLEMRKARNEGPATVNQIHDALVEGGLASLAALVIAASCGGWGLFPTRPRWPPGSSTALGTWATF